MGDYQAIFYAIHRTPIMKAVLGQLGRVPSLWGQELLTSSLPLIAGGAERVPRYFMARNTNPSIATEGWHPYHFFASEPAKLFREYAEYRAVTLEHLAADARGQSTYQLEQIERAFDLVHLKYLTPMLIPRIMDYLIEQTTRSEMTSQQIVEGAWKVLADSSNGRARGRGSNLARLGGRLDPNFIAKAARYLNRVSRLYVWLRFREKVEVSLTPSLNKMVITRTVRNGQPRRYILSRTMLYQDLGDGNHLTSSHVRDIVQHFDDYL
jgi:hypothetical protein